MNKKIPVSIIIVAHNEEMNIEDCLKSVEWASDIIVVDGNSEDRTAELARKFTSKVYVKENADCETQRIFGLNHADNNWVFLLDADERVSSDLAQSIEGAISNGSEFTAYKILRRNYIKGKSKPVHFNHPEYHLRFFRKNGLVSLPEKIHRVPEIKGDAGCLNGELEHQFFDSVTQYIKKMDFYTTLEAQYCLQDPNFTLKGLKGFSRLFIRPVARFAKNYFLKKAFLDGYWGMFFSLGTGYYEVLTNMKIILSKKR